MKLSKEEFLALSAQMYDKMSENMDSDHQDFYTYESTFDKLITEFGSQVLEKSLEEEEISERKKKSANAIWKNKDSK